MYHKQCNASCPNTFLYPPPQPMFLSVTHCCNISWVIWKNYASSLAGKHHCSSLYLIGACFPSLSVSYSLIRIKVKTVWCARSKSLCHWYLFCRCLFVFSVPQQARAEQEEEFISNTLFKKIQALQKEKETLAVNYEKEEEFLTNELSRKLMQVSDRNKIGWGGAHF